MTMRIPGPLRHYQKIDDGILARQSSKPGPLRINAPAFSGTAHTAQKSQRKKPRKNEFWYFHADEWRKRILSKGKIKKTFDGFQEFDVTYYPAAGKVTVDVYIKFDFVVDTNLVHFPNPSGPKTLPAISKEVKDRWSDDEKSDYKREFFKTINAAWADSFVVFNKDLRLKADVHINLVDLNYPFSHSRSFKWLHAHKGAHGGAHVSGTGTNMSLWRVDIGRFAVHEFGHFMKLGDAYVDEERGLKAGDKTDHSGLTKKYLNKETLIGEDPNSLMEGGGELRARHGLIFAWALHKMTEYNGWSVRLK
jgi:hypothetical protein